MYISFNSHNRFTKETLLIASDVDVFIFFTEEYTLLHYEHESEKMHFELSQNATVTNCDNLSILAVAFCDLSHFVIMAVTAQTESNNTETCSGYLPILALFNCYICLCMYISFNYHNRFTKETLLIVSDVDVYMFPVLRSIPSCTTDMNLRSCILNRHKMRQSHFVICRIL